jgi:predicted lactoylglutathione lyase
MPRMLFVSLPVQELSTSVAFFAGLGFEFDEHFTDDRAACMVISEQACVMLLAAPVFSTFTTRDVAGAATTEAILAVSARSREEVDVLVDAALALGGDTGRAATDEGYLYGRSFFDLDGHAWEVMWMDPGMAG